MAGVGGSSGAASSGAAATGGAAGGEHKLGDSWCVWEGHAQDKKYEGHWNDSRITIYEFDTVEDFWRRWALQPRLNEVFIFPEGQQKVKRKDAKKPEMRTYAIESYQVFRKSVQPFTEWPAKSRRATKCVYRSTTEMRDDDMRSWDALWEHLVMLTIGETLPGCEKLNGVGVTDKSAKASNYKINLDLWFNEGDSDSIKATVRKLNELLGGFAESKGMKFSNFALHKDYTV